MEVADQVNKSVKVKIEDLKSKIRNIRYLFCVLKSAVSKSITIAKRSIFFIRWKSMFSQIFDDILSVKKVSK